MAKDFILNTVRMLANSQGFYGRLLRDLEDVEDEAWAKLDEYDFSDPLDVVMFFEEGQLPKRKAVEVKEVA